MAHGLLRGVRRTLASMLFLFAAILLAVPWVLPFFGLHTTFRWQHVQGEVIESSVREIRTGEGMRYGPGVVYRYEFNGKSYVNNRLGFYDQFVEDPKKPLEIATRLPRGTKVNVLVNPDLPSESLLEHRRFWEIVWLLLLPLILVSAAVWLWRK